MIQSDNKEYESKNNGHETMCVASYQYLEADYIL